MHVTGVGFNHEMCQKILVKLPSTKFRENPIQQF
jgi:hypothetical protein